MTTYSFSQLEGLWISAGGPRWRAPLMAAIAMAESGGRSDAVGPPTQYGQAKGIWQILGNPFPGNPFNPQINAKMAVAKYRSQGLGAWATYTSGAYKQFLRNHPPPPTGAPGPGPGPVQTTSALSSLFNLFTNPSDMLQRLGLVVFGGLLIVVGVMMIAGNKTLELTKSASKPKENGGSKSGVRREKGQGSVLRDGAAAEE